MVLSVFLIFNLPQIEKIEAGTTDNISGWAWSENIGWISFNNTSGGGSTNYGVNVDTSTGAFSGYAWSENIGWIKFGDPLKIATENYPNCPLSTCSTGSPNYSAKLDLATNKITGWARACAGTVNGDCNSAARTDGWDGWILLGPIMKGGTDYGVERDICDLKGFAWGSDVVGWIKLNGSNYKVVTTFCESVNQPPSATSLSNNNSILDYCSYTPSYIILSWVFSDEPGDTQGAYRVQVTRQSDGTTYDSGQRSGIISSITAQTINTEKGSNFIWYGDSYTWQVKVWDNHDAESAWASGSFFTTPKHAYPDVYPPYDFIWNPLKPAVGENTQFTDRSACYNINNNPVPCSGNGPCGTPWCWTFQNGNPANSKQQNPLVKFLSTGTKSVTLRVTDSDGFNCQIQKTVSSQLPLPEWIEIPPF